MVAHAFFSIEKWHIGLEKDLDREHSVTKR